MSACKRAPSAFNTDKLIWLNQHYIKTLPAEQVAEHLAWHLAEQKLNTENGPAITEVISVQAERVKTLKELIEVSRYFYEDFTDFEENAAKKHLRVVAAEPLALVQAKLAELTTWDAANIHHTINAAAEALGLGMGKVGMPLRVAVTGGGNSPALDQTLYLVGKERALARITLALDYIKQRAESN